jgi:allantoinase
MKLPDEGDFMKAWGGISSLQLRLPVVWTDARARGLAFEDLVRWLCREPARQVGLASLKGAIKDGYDADIIIWNPDREFKVEAAMLHHRHKLTPYNGEVLRGVVEKTFLRGQIVYDDGRFSASSGRVILRTTD